MDLQVAKMFSAAIALLPLFGVALALGNIFSTLISSIARNPSAKDAMLPVAILGFALTETVALFSLLISFLILF